ncbi:hypothetical protein, partial [Enterobacter hormaechei]|uniref:hypothetical protein n=1 Tax=Enterobacter hormaechei TaxID=158836 RepID=UPI00403B03E2
VVSKISTLNSKTSIEKSKSQSNVYKRDSYFPHRSRMPAYRIVVSPLFGILSLRSACEII